MTYFAARPTTYRGIPMRSRLEAHCAADLDGSGLAWTYEPRAYAGPTGQYLPDFEVTVDDQRLFVEVRPTLERALVAIGQMSLIWQSLPDAKLLILYDRQPDGAWRHMDGKGGRWTAGGWGS